MSLGNKHVDEKVASLYEAGSPQFERTMGALLGPGILPGNRAQALVNGEQIFPAMLEAIHGAQRSITFETYIWWSGEIAKKFSAALCERAKAGVEVNVTVDWAGS
ncbi:MAG: cardiolipin synthase B, partial [Gammaproteobacteria bacterium]